MDKKLYDELVNRNIITDTFMTLEKINERGIKLEDIVTQPEMYKIFSKYVSNEEVNEETQPTQLTNPVKDPDKVVDDQDKVVEGPDKDVEVEPIKEEEGIVVDDTVEPVAQAPKSKSKKSKEVAGK